MKPLLFFLSWALFTEGGARGGDEPKLLHTTMPVFSLFDLVVRAAVRADELKHNQPWLDDQLKEACHNVTLFFLINSNIKPEPRLDFELMTFLTHFVDTVDDLASTSAVREEVLPLTSFLTAEGKARLLKELSLRKDVEWLAWKLEAPVKAGEKPGTDASGAGDKGKKGSQASADGAYERLLDRWLGRIQKRYLVDTPCRCLFGMNFFDGEVEDALSLTEVPQLADLSVKGADSLLLARIKRPSDDNLSVDTWCAELLVFRYHLGLKRRSTATNAGFLENVERLVKAQAEDDGKSPRPHAKSS